MCNALSTTTLSNASGTKHSTTKRTTWSTSTGIMPTRISAHREEVEEWLKALGVADYQFNDANPNGLSVMLMKPI